MAKNAYINLYTGATADGVDGVAVSIGADKSTPLTIKVNASNNESKTVAVAIRCEDGYETVGNTTISLLNDANSKWSLCDTETGTFASTLTLTDIGTTNKIFYVKATSDNSETPDNDESVQIKVEAEIGKVVAAATPDPNPGT